MSEEFELLINNETDVKLASVEMFCAGKEGIRNRKMTNTIIIARNEYRTEIWNCNMFSLYCIIVSFIVF